MHSYNLLPPFAHQKETLLAKYSTFGIGGPALFFATAISVEQMQQMISFAHQENLPFFILGKGSNVLFDDKGYRGLVILNKITGILQNNESFLVGSGESFPKLGITTAKKGFKGLEFAAGIPATVGGALFMNAGSAGQQTFDCLTEVEYIFASGERKRFSKDQLTWGYRTSCFQAWKGAIVSASFTLQLDEQATAKQRKLVDYRLHTQPYGMKSAGCVFKNPESMSAGGLIDSLKGLRVGGVSVSTKHANFIVNDAKGTAADVLELIKEIKKRVFAEKGISLHEEIRYIPYDERVSSRSSLS